jgi:hypothetical protein
MILNLIRANPMFVPKWDFIPLRNHKHNHQSWLFYLNSMLLPPKQQVPLIDSCASSDSCISILSL